MGASAGFHADAARWQLGHDVEEVCPCNALRESDFPLCINPMELKDIL
jgi:hypothetical protein